MVANSVHLGADRVMACVAASSNLSKDVSRIAGEKVRGFTAQFALALATFCRVERPVPASSFALADAVWDMTGYCRRR